VEEQAFSITFDDVTEEERARMTCLNTETNGKSSLLQSIEELDDDGHPITSSASQKSRAAAIEHARRKKGFVRRSTGFAFSCDEETTMAESFIAANVQTKTDALTTANRNSHRNLHQHY